MEEQDKRLTEEGDDLLQSSEALYRIAAFQYHETLGNIMEKNVYLCRRNDSVHAAAEEMARRKISSVVVADEDAKLLGIVTERDMVRKVIAEQGTGSDDKKIAEIMTPAPIFLSPDDSLFDALSIFSKYSIKHLPIVQLNRVVGIVTLRQIMKIRHAEPFVIIGELEKAETVQDFRKIKEDIIYLTHEKLEANTDPVDIVTMLTLANSAIHKRLLHKAIFKTGTEPPVDFCCFVTGSHGRKENLLFPDQDFCVIIADYDDSHYNDFDAYFLQVSLSFSDYLNEVGFPFCSGNVMGQNPTWRKRLTEWLAHLTYIFERPGEYTVRYISLIFDAAPLYGFKPLFGQIQDFAFTLLSRNHNILRMMHEEEGSHRVPLGWFHTFITEKGKFHRGEIDMKRSGLIFFIEAARILALKHGIRETSTLSRIRALVGKGVIHKDDSEYFENAYRVILYHTLKAQTENYLSKQENNYYLKPDELSARNQEVLKQAFKAIAQLKEIVGSELGELIM